MATDTPPRTYVAFLRAINLGATRKFPKDAIVASARAAGFEATSTMDAWGREVFIAHRPAGPEGADEEGHG